MADELSRRLAIKDRFRSHQSRDWASRFGQAVFAILLIKLSTASRAKMVDVWIRHFDMETGHLVVRLVGSRFVTDAESISAESDLWRPNATRVKVLDT